MVHLLTILDTFFGNKNLLLGVLTLSVLLRSLILIIFARQSKSALSKPRLLIISMLVCSIAVDSAWIINLIHQLFSPGIDYKILIFSSRISWGFDALLYLSITLFTSVLIQQQRNFSLHQKFLCLWYMTFFILFTVMAIFNINCNNMTDRWQVERIIQDIFRSSTSIFLLVSILFNIWKMHHTALPRILKKQLKVFVYGIMSTFWLADSIQIFPLNIPDAYTNSYAGVTISTIMLTFAILFALRKFIGLRFLNTHHQVQSSKARYNFIDEFKNVLEQLSHATSIKELQQLTQIYFKDMFRIPLSRTTLYLRSKANTDHKNHLSHIETTVENFILLQQEILSKYAQKERIFIFDEISFSHFYAQDEPSATILHFLDAINADIFIPIYAKEKIIGYIIIERFARPTELYSNVEHDEMVVYTSYLSNIINLLQTRNIETMLYREKELQEELFAKHQEINQYKESIRSFLRNQRQKDIGIIFYKNRRFTYANQTAKELIDVNINLAQGHPITIKLKDLARKVQEYKTPQSVIIKDKEGQKLVLSAVAHLEQNTVIIMIYYPEISDLVKKQLQSLKDPSKWDYLLYLETTESGKLINQLIPGSGEHLLDFKIALLQSALSKRATLLEMPEEDLLPTAKLLHHISLRETLQVIKLTQPNTGNELPIKLFGINPIFGVQSEEKPLFEKLDNTGTIFFQNIHLLDLETQQYLAEYLMYGTYRIFKSEQRLASNVRILCSTNKNLQILVQENKFNQDLFNCLKKQALSLPSLSTLPDAEIHQLAEGYTEQALKTDDFKNLLELTPKEKDKISSHRPISLHEFKHKIQQVLLHKSKKNQVYDEAHFDPAYEINDPELIDAARLGKHALRDERMMVLLWNKFQSQSKIASFLGVNRSSVNRRCKAYKLTEE